MPPPTWTNDIQAALRAGTFFWTVEFVTPESAEPFEAAVKPAVELAERVRTEPRVAGLSITDRVRSEADHDPVAVAARIAEASGKQPLVHLAGKDRELADLQKSLDRMRERGLANALIITGDRVKAEPGDRRVRYLESVPAIVAAKQAWPALRSAPGRTTRSPRSGTTWRSSRSWRGGARGGAGRFPWWRT
jgi:5,10-methylenetetrahydrofolate reductase